MKQKDLDTWEEFEDLLIQLQGMRQEVIESVDGSVSDFLFRGQGRVEYSLETTLDRAPGGPWSFGAPDLASDRPLKRCVKLRELLLR